MSDEPGVLDFGDNHKSAPDLMNNTGLSNVLLDIFVSNLSKSPSLTSRDFVCPNGVHSCHPNY